MSTPSNQRFGPRTCALAALLGVLATPLSAAAAGSGAGGPTGWRAALAVEQEQAVPLLGRAEALRHRSFRLHGIPLRRAHATIRSGEAGDRVVREELPAEGPELLPAQARIGAAEATALAREHARGTRPSPPASDGEGTLVYLVILGVPVLAYEVDLELDLGGPEPSKRTIWVSASSGIVLDEWEHVRASKARVFLTNPAKTPEPVIVELSGVHAKGPGEPLVGDVVQSYNCTLEPQPPEELPEWWKEGKCYPVHRALSNADGDFFVKMPDIVLPEDNADGDDAYAELSMYWHAERFLDRMAALGVGKFKCDLSTMLANYRDPMLSPSYPDLPYTPLNNAYWTNTCDPAKGVTMIFGQGSAVDFGYDGDVVYHELGHGMVSLLTPNGLGGRKNRSDGVVSDAGGLNEAIADYFSVMLTSDPELGDYVARFWPGYGDSIRSAENQKTCPDDTVGQVHNDGEPFMAAMWAIRKRVGGEKLDPLVLDLLSYLPIDADLEDASTTVLELAEDAGWSATELDHLIRAFDTRGLFQCERVITDPERVASGRSMYLRPKTTAVTPYFPGPMQLRHTVADGTDNVVVRFRKAGGSGVPGNDAGVLVLLKRADAPIEFSYTLTALDKSADGGSKASVREVTTVVGDHDLELQATLLGESDNQLVLRGFRPGEVVHVAFASLQTSETTISGATLLSLPTEFLDEGAVHVDVDVGESESESEVGGDAGVVTPEVDTGDAATACACRGGRASGTAWLALALLGLARRRRRT